MIILSKYNLFNFPNNGHDRVRENFCRLRQTFRKTKNKFIVKMGLDGLGLDSPLIVFIEKSLIVVHTARLSHSP